MFEMSFTEVATQECAIWNHTMYEYLCLNTEVDFMPCEIFKAVVMRSVGLSS